MKNFQSYTLLEKTIKTAGKKAQELRREGLSIRVKGRQDFVSQADVMVEQLLKEAILTLYPQDSFLGEESGLEVAEKKLKGAANIDNGVWVIDPIDGTTNFMQGMDYWCISIAYVVAGIIEIAFVYAPDRDEFFFAKSGEGAYLNGQRLMVTEPEKGQAIIGLGRSNRRSLENYVQTLTVLDQQGVEYRRFGAGALMLAHVASGLVNGYYESHLNSWDALAGLLLIKESGGCISNFLANEGLLKGNVVWAASPILWQQLNIGLVIET
jgi:myo-inositol-1(or 4)-monophosphatase